MHECLKDFKHFKHKTADNVQLGKWVMHCKEINVLIHATEQKSPPAQDLAHQATSCVTGALQKVRFITDKEQYNKRDGFEQ